MKTLRAFISRNDSRISRHNAPLTADGKAERREAGREMEGDGPKGEAYLPWFWGRQCSF